MNVTYSAKARESNDWPLMEKATGLLDEVLGPSSPHVKKEWDSSKDERGGAVHMLSLSDWTGTASTTFAPSDLMSHNRMRVLLHRLWGELLQARADKHLKQLQESGD